MHAPSHRLAARLEDARHRAAEARRTHDYAGAAYADAEARAIVRQLRRASCMSAH